MKVITNEPVPFDVDDTLVMHTFDKNEPNASYVLVIDHAHPEHTNRTIQMKVNLPMVRLLQEELMKGSQVIIWSRSGYQHAFNVVHALIGASYLRLYPEHNEIIVMPKPRVYMDDTEVQNWIKDRVYIGPDVPYKV